MPTTIMCQGSSSSHKEELSDSDEQLVSNVSRTMVEAPWIPKESGTIASFGFLKANGVTEITGNIMCTKCKTTKLLTICVTEHTKYEMATFLNRSIAAPYRGTDIAWFNPDLPNCQNCEGEECTMVPVLSDEIDAIDWLFVFLGQMLIFCSFNQLCSYCYMNEMTIPKTKLQAIRGVYYHLLYQFLAD